MPERLSDEDKKLALGSSGRHGSRPNLSSASRATSTIYRKGSGRLLSSAPACSIISATLILRRKGDRKRQMAGRRARGPSAAGRRSDKTWPVFRTLNTRYGRADGGAGRRPDRNYGELEISDSVTKILGQLTALIDAVAEIEWENGVEPAPDLNFSAAAAAELWADEAKRPSGTSW